MSWCNINLSLSLSLSTGLAYHSNRIKRIKDGKEKDVILGRLIRIRGRVIGDNTIRRPKTIKAKQNKALHPHSMNDY